MALAEFLNRADLHHQKLLIYNTQTKLIGITMNYRQALQFIHKFAT
jgi:hypothetical protein